jgi:predicted DNA-binding transcriptional regulator YafY
MLERIFKIAIRLIKEKEVSVAFLLKEHQIKERTLFHDLSFIRSAINIKTKKGLVCLLNTSQITSNELLVRLLKIYTKFDKEVVDALEYKDNELSSSISLEEIGNLSEHLRHFETTIEAIKFENSVEFIYCHPHKKSKRAVFPFNIMQFSSSDWYLIAYDKSSESIKTFHFNYIEDMQIVKDILDDYYAKRNHALGVASESVSVWFSPDVKRYEVLLEINEKIAHYFTRKPISKTQVVNKVLDSGAIELSILITNDMEILPIVKQYMPFIRVVKPRRIEDLVMQEISKYIAYQHNRS